MTRQDTSENKGVIAKLTDSVFSYFGYERRESSEYAGNRPITTQNKLMPEQNLTQKEMSTPRENNLLKEELLTKYPNLRKHFECGQFAFFNCP